MRFVTAKWTKQCFKLWRMDVAFKTVEQFFDLHKNTSCNSQHQSVLKETTENYLGETSCSSYSTKKYCHIKKKVKFVYVTLLPITKQWRQNSATYLEKQRCLDLLLHCDSSREQPNWLSLHPVPQGQMDTFELAGKAVSNILSHCYTFKMCSHYVLTGSLLCMRSDLNWRLFSRKGFPVHFRRCGGLYTVTISRIWNLKNCFRLVAHNSFKALKLLAPMSQTVGPTCSPAFWHAPRTSFKNFTKRSDFVLRRMT
jgi:hypothetical protein